MESERWMGTVEDTLLSSLDAQKACEVCGKGLKSGRPLVHARLRSRYEPHHERVVWVCLFCVEGRWKQEVSELRRRYRREYNERHLGEMAHAMRHLPQTSARRLFLQAYDSGHSISPSVLESVRNDFMRLP